MTLRGVEVRLYVDGEHELRVLEPIGDELARRGAKVSTTQDFSVRSDVGLYACHTNRFFDFATGRWRRPPNGLSVLAVHDLGQSDGFDPEYFSREQWHVFDLGLLPGPAWQQMWEQASRANHAGPTLGMRGVGWPKMDHVFADPAEFERRVQRTRNALGIDERNVVLLACSWSDRRQLHDTLNAIASSDIQIVVKYPADDDPPSDSPWFERLSEAAWERKMAQSLARASDRVVVAGDQTDIMELISLSNVVLSNGSNVLFEGLLMGVPGISVQDWVWPCGRYGQDTMRPPPTAISGILSGGLPSLPEMLKIVQGVEWRKLVTEGGGMLVDAASRGRAARNSADEIEAALAANRPARAERESVTATTSIQGALKAAHDRELQAWKALVAHELRLKQLTSQLNDLGQTSEPILDRAEPHAQRDAALAERDSALAERDAVIAQRDGLATEHVAVLADREDLMAEISAQAAAYDRLRAELQGLDEQRGEIIADRSRIIAHGERLAAEVKSLAIERARLELELSHLAAELRTVLGSRSWRFTARLRGLVGRIKGRR